MTSRAELRVTQAIVADGVAVQDVRSKRLVGGRIDRMRTAVRYELGQELESSSRQVNGNKQKTTHLVYCRTAAELLAKRNRAAVMKTQAGYFFVFFVQVAG